MSVSEKAVISKTNDILTQFFTAWKNEDWETMSDACQPSWREFTKKTRMICRHCKHFDYLNITKRAIAETKKIMNKIIGSKTKSALPNAYC